MLFCGVFARYQSKLAILELDAGSLLRQRQLSFQWHTAGIEQVEEVAMGQGNLGKHRRAGIQQAPTAEDALHHLLLTVDVEHLYR